MSRKATKAFFTTSFIENVIGNMGKKGSTVPFKNSWF